MTRLARTLALLALVGAASAAPPPHTITSVVRSGSAVPGVGTISYPCCFFDPGQGVGIYKAAINNAGEYIVDIHVNQTDTNFDQALLTEALGLSPYIAEGVAGFLSVPNTDHVANGFHSLSLNNAGVPGLAMGLFPDDFSMTMPTSGVYFRTTALPALEGSVIAAAGLAPGTTWNRFDAGTRVQINDNNQILVVSGITESAVSRRAVVVLQVSPMGVLAGATLIAKEGGPVGAGADTWASIAAGGHAAAINNGGRVVFSGTTAGGVNGIFATGGTGPTGFVAVQGGPSPTPGSNWGSLAGSPVDINNNGIVAFRGRLADGSGIFTESLDAGELIDTASRTFGNGPITNITGALSDDADVDMFRIIVDNPATFSATTVPDPGSGFPGAAFDSVLTLIASPENGTRGIVQADNVSSGVTQSTLTAPTVVAGREFYICISTPKARPFASLNYPSTGAYVNADLWAPDPSGLAVAGGLLYWPDPSLASISRATTSGSAQAPLAAPAITPHLAVDQSGGRVYWIDRGVGGAGGGAKMRRANLNGSDPQEIVTATAFGSLGVGGATGIALDLVNGKVYWSRAALGEINRANLDGSAAERVIQDYPPTDAIHPPAGGGLPVGNFAPQSLAVDPANGRVYFYNHFFNRIQRANLDGTGRTSLPAGAGAGASQIALDIPAGHIYWTNTAGNRIQRCNLDGSGIVDVLTTTAPVALALDTAGGFLYFTSTVDRTIRRATLAGAGPTTITSIPAETGQQSTDGPGAGNTFAQWLRTSAPAPGVLPYQIRLTGATFRHENAMLVKGSTKVVAVGDVIPGTSGNPLTTLASPTAAIRISDRGDVLWAGSFYQPTPFNNYLFDALFWNGERLLISMDIYSGTNLSAEKLVNVYKNAYSLDMSDSGEYAIATVNLQVAPYVFTSQPDHALRFRFTLPPACIADFNGSGSVTVQDIFDFLAAYFSALPSADVNNSGSVTVQDIFDFLAAYFAGC